MSGTPPPATGFPCSACRTATRVRWTHTVGATVRRVRYCPACGYRFSTTERPVNPTPETAAPGQHGPRHPS